MKIQRNYVVNVRKEVKTEYFQKAYATWYIFSNYFEIFQNIFFK